ncbi:MAG: GNAT family N-acetyltransferase [Clostridia bacterium]|nr:GNAT family N-acetyltransferase [Clostridia bacterium]
MNIRFEMMTANHTKKVMDIFNDYAENSFAAYPPVKLPYEFYGKFLEMTKGYPAYVIQNNEDEKVLGFCFLRAYNPLPTFKDTAEATYFIDRYATGKGIGKAALKLLEADAKKLGIKRLLANISSLNTQSLEFHLRNGFRECGRLHHIGFKMGKRFDVVWMEKELINI